MAIVGAGIIGLAHAYLAAKSGLKVIVFERDPRATEASIRNFGMIWPIGQPAGHLHKTALRSRELWLDVLREAGLPYQPTGSLHAAYRADEAAVGIEFAGKAKGFGYDSTWLSAKEASRSQRRSQSGKPSGALWSPVELTVDPRVVIGQLPAFLAERYGVEFRFNTAVQEVAIPVLTTGRKTWSAKTVVLAAGDDFQTLFPETLAGFGLRLCKLQMLRTVPQPAGWQLGPSLAFGLSFRHYAAFEICEACLRWQRALRKKHPSLTVGAFT